MKKLLDYVFDVLVEKKCRELFFHLALFSFIAIAVYNVFFGKGYLCDTVEHIQASYLVSLGKLPYKDFFEHHNPLLWYLFAPITKLFFQDITIFTIAKGIGAIGYLTIFWLSYKINVRFFNDKNSAKLSVLILLSVPYLWCDIATLRPDIFMGISFFCALYCLFSYLEKNATQKLILSYLFMGLSFLFLQKIVFMGIGFLLFNIYLLYTKQLRVSDFFLAAGISGLLLASFAGFLISKGLFASWFYYNFEFNMLMKRYYSGYTSGYSSILPLLTLLSVVIILRCYVRERRQDGWVLLYLFSILSIVIFAPHPQYYLIYWVFASVLLGNILYRSPYFKYAYTLLVVILCISFYQFIPSWQNQRYYQTYKNSINYIWHNSSKAPADFLSLTKITHNVLIENSSYYWFGFHNVVIIDLIYDLERNFDLKYTLETKKPQLISYQQSILPSLNDMLVFEKGKYFIDRNTDILRKSRHNPEFLSHIIPIDSDFWRLNTKWIEEHYDPIQGTNLWKLKAP